MLKAFRNWWENSRYYFNNAIYGRWTRKGWKAALRWVLKEINEKGIDQIEELIEEELKI